MWHATFTPTGQDLSEHVRKRVGRPRLTWLRGVWTQIYETLFGEDAVEEDANILAPSVSEPHNSSLPSN
eukprot:3297670-Amphidinium_carterae.1